MTEQDTQRRKLVSLIASRAKPTGRAPDDETQIAVPRGALASLVGKRGDMRITISETEDGLGIHNPGRHFIPMILFLLLWLGGWTAGELFVLHEIFFGGPLFADLFLLVWITLWTFGGIAVWSAVLWQLFGVERFFITGGAVVREAGLWRFRRRRIYPLATVRNFRLASALKDAGKKKKAEGGLIAFDVSGETMRFGIGMSEEEAKLSLAAIQRYLPQNGGEDEKGAPSMSPAV